MSSAGRSATKLELEDVAQHDESGHNRIAAALTLLDRA